MTTRPGCGTRRPENSIDILQGHAELVWSAAFSPDGQAHHHGVVRSSGKALGRADRAGNRHLEWPCQLRAERGIRPDGKRVVTSSADQTARLWDVETAKEIAVLKGHTNFVQSAAFSPDGNRVLTSSDDKTARVLDVTWATTVRGDALRERICTEKLVGAAQEFTPLELEDTLLQGIDPADAVARNPCLRRGPLAMGYWLRLPGELWHLARAHAWANQAPREP